MPHFLQKENNSKYSIGRNLGLNSLPLPPVSPCIPYVGYGNRCHQSEWDKHCHILIYDSPFPSESLIPQQELIKNSQVSRPDNRVKGIAIHSNVNLIIWTPIHARSKRDRFEVPVQHHPNGTVTIFDG